MRHNVDGGRELDVAADMVAVRVRVDQRRDRLLGQRLDLVEDRLTPPWVLRVHDHDSVGRDEDGCIPSAPFQDEQVVFEFFDLDDAGSLLPALLRRHDQRQRTHGNQHAQNNASLHATPPEKRRVERTRMRPWR